MTLIDWLAYENYQERLSCGDTLNPTELEDFDRLAEMVPTEDYWLTTGV